MSIVEKKIFNNIVSRLSKHVFSYYELTEESEIKKCMPDEVAKESNRFDILAKLIYIKAYLKKVDSPFFKNLYLAHIHAFNGFFENDGSGKDTPEKYITAIDFLINSAVNSNYNFLNSLIPLDQYGCLIDCAHRLALHIAYQKNVQTIQLKPTKSDNSFCYNYDFFQKNGFKRCYSDYIAYQYIKHFNNSRIILLFPAEEVSEYDEIIKQSFSVFYKKKFHLTPNGQLNFIKQMYISEEWLGSVDDNYSGAQYKRSQCFQNNNHVIAYLVNNCSNDDIIYIKKLIRKKACRGNHSVHSTDCHNTTINLGSLIFNENSIESLNYRKVNNFSKFDTFFNKFSQLLSRDIFQSDNFCVSGSSVLSFFGIRECYDFDYLCCGEDSLHLDDPLMSLHNTHINSLIVSSDIISIDDIVLNPNNHFFYNGIKFMTLKNIIKLKRIRNENKDIKDISLIERFLNNKIS